MTDPLPPQDNHAQPDAARSAPPAHVRSRRRYGRRMGDQPEGESRIWMITFTDIMGLMLTFFVMMYAMSHPKQEEWQDLTDTVQSQFNRYYGQVMNRGENEAINIDRVDMNQALNLDYLRALMEALVAKQTNLGAVALITQSDSLILSLPQELLFNPGQAVVKEEGLRALHDVAEMLSRIRNRVEIVGHADPRPIATEEFPSNWDLSLARASRVAAALADAGYARSVIVRGQASGRYADLPKSLPEDTRLGLSRRVDIVIMEDDGKRVKRLGKGAL